MKIKLKNGLKNWDDKTRKDKKEIQSKIGQATASVFEPDEKQIYIYKLHGVVVWILLMMHSVCQ